MSSPQKIGVAVVLVAVIGACAWWVVSRAVPEKAPKPMLGWKCSTCDHRFQAEPPDVAETARAETASFPKVPCPKCKADAYRIVPYRCTKCSHEFDLTLAPDPTTGAPPSFTCPKCGNARIEATAGSGKE